MRLLFAAILLYPWLAFGQVCQPGQACYRQPSYFTVPSSGWSSSTTVTRPSGATRVRGRSGSYYYAQPSRPTVSAAPATQPWRPSPSPATTRPSTVLPGPGPESKPSYTTSLVPSPSSGRSLDVLFAQSQSLTLQINQSIADTREIEKRLTDVEDTVGNLVAIAPPISEDPLPGPGDVPPLPDGTEPITVPPPAVDYSDELNIIREQLRILLVKIEGLGAPPTFDVVILGKDDTVVSTQKWEDIVKRKQIRIPPLSFKSADTGQTVTGGLGQTFPFVLVPNQGQQEAE